MRHLCQTLHVQTLVAHPDLLHKMADRSLAPRLVPVPRLSDLHGHVSLSCPLEDCHMPSNAYICHSSGTASGLPKPIYQSQHGVVGCLYPFQRMRDGHPVPATFTVTPLFHGGTPDCLRAWSSGAMCWIFPQASVPITGTNVIRAVNAARVGAGDVGYFSSVPFVLQMLLDVDRNEGLELLQTFDLVGFGGAALPRTVGDKLVQAGVKLLSRMGSAECGFLMSSHRDYANDTEWEYMRPIADTSLLSFEDRGGGLSELVVREKWPFKTKTNCDEGKAYATADLFESHPRKSNVWRYHGRADAQIVLANGKKFDPVPVEADILAAAARLRLRDVLIFGTDMSQAGALLFPDPAVKSTTCFADSVWEIIDEMNSRSQSHARIAKSMLIVVTGDEADDPPLPRSSKGTVMRARAEAMYERHIKRAQSASSDLTPRPDDELLEAVTSIFADILGRDVNRNGDLYQQGVDSISCAQIRSRLQSRCLVDGSLPLNVVYDQRTVTGIAEYLLRLRHGIVQDASKETDAELNAMKELVNQYGAFRFSDSAKVARPNQVENTVVLTGATGFLGAHLLHSLRQDPSINDIFCLVRAQDNDEATGRVSAALVQYGRPGLDVVGGSTRCLACDLSATDLGLSTNDWLAILRKATIFIHAAWAVNFNLGLRSFEDQVSGTRNLINFANGAHARFFFLSSTAAVSASPSDSIPETLSQDPLDASPLGYSRSKWVAEQICDAANRANDTPFVSVIRVGQLCANEKGIWNASEAYPLMLSTARVTGCLPVIDDRLDWIPVEEAAQAVLEIAQHQSQDTVTPVYHVVNCRNSPTWSMLLQQLKGRDESAWIQDVSPWHWIEKLESAIEKGEYSHHPSQALLDLWKTSYGSAGGMKSDGDTERRSEAPKFETRRAQAASTLMKYIRPFDLARVDDIWDWVDRTILSKGHEVNGEEK